MKLHFNRETARNLFYALALIAVGAASFAGQQYRSSANRSHSDVRWGEIDQHITQACALRAK